MAIKWAFYRDSSGHFRWEVHGDGGPIAGAGKTFETVDACVADARVCGFHGTADPAVSSEPNFHERSAKRQKAAGHER